MKYILIIFMICLAGIAQADTLGKPDTSIFSSAAFQPREAEDTAVAILITVPSVGTIDSIYAFIESSITANWKAALYDGADLVDSATERSISATTNLEWRGFGFPTPVDVTAKDYRIVVWSEGGAGTYDVGVRFQFGQLPIDSVYYYDIETYGAWPEPPTWQTPAFAIGFLYAIFTPASLGPENVIHSPDGSGIHHSLNGASVLHEQN